VHDGFSGGEIKKAELLQVMLQRPAVVLVDEPDAGVDLDNITLVGEGLAGLLHTPLPDGSAPAGLVITHTGHVLSHVRADVGHVLVGGTLVGEAGADRLLEEIRRHGYGKCPLCRSQTLAH
jgi:Fe-S cluster assembly ATP-binding protein